MFFIWHLKIKAYNTCVLIRKTKNLFNNYENMKKIIKIEKFGFEANFELERIFYYGNKENLIPMVSSDYTGEWEVFSFKKEKRTISITNGWGSSFSDYYLIIPEDCVIIHNH